MLRYLAPALLGLVALTQVVQARIYGQLTPSKGGGFGMFSTVDKYENRHARLRINGQSVTLTPQSAAWLAVQDAVSAPTDAHLGEAVRQVQRELALEVGSVIVIEVYGLSYDPAATSVTRTRLATRSVTVTP